MNSQTPSGWRRDLPDSDITVLMRLNEVEEIWPGFHDGEYWRYASGDRLMTSKVRGWMHLDEAARILDAHHL